MRERKNLVNVLRELENSGIYLNVYYTTNLDSQNKINNKAQLYTEDNEIYVKVNDNIKNIFNSIDYALVKESKTGSYPQEFENAYNDCKRVIQEDGLLGINRYCEGVLQPYYSPDNRSVTVNAGVALKLSRLEVKEYLNLVFQEEMIELNKIESKLEEHNNILSTVGYIRTIDIERKKKVEIKAVEIVTKHYESMNYNVASREKDNIGWDLDVIKGNEKIKVEVKGLSGNSIYVELTPNEYANLKKYYVDYIVAIVLNVLEQPKLFLFKYYPDRKKFITLDGAITIPVAERVSAVIQANTA